MNEKWQKSLTDVLSLYEEALSPKRKTRLRFDAPFLGVYEIADQFFCEKQVEISRREGELETSLTKRGKELHQALSIGMKQAKTDEIWKEIFSRRGIAIMNMLLIAKWEKVLIIGRPDFVFFKDSKPLWLFEYKFTNMRIPPDSSHVQARLYSLLLKLMGFDISLLKCAIVLANEKPQQFDNWRRSVFSKVARTKTLKEKAVVKVDAGRVFLRRPDFKKAENELSFALGYWKFEREVIPTRNPSKCMACRYSQHCDSRSVQSSLIST